MNKLRIGVQTRSLRQPLRRALETAARLGADGVEINLRSELPLAELSRTGIRQLRKLLEDLRLGVAAVAYPTRRGLGDPGQLDRRIAAIRQAMETAYQLGARVVVNHLGDLPEDEAPDRLLDSLQALGLHGERVGARLAAATGRESGERLATLLARLPEKTIGANLNPAQLLAHGHDPLASVHALGDSILHVQATDAVRDLAERQVVEVELGRGGVEFPELLATLQEYGYQGWVTIERRESAHPLQDIESAVAYLRAL